MSFYNPTGLPVLRTLSYDDFVVAGDASGVGKASIASLMAAGGSTINALTYGADPTGVSDSSAAMSAAWAALKAVRNTTYTAVPITLVIPPGIYLIGTSIDWTGGTSSTFLAWNTTVVAEGAIFVGSCTGKAVVDMIGVRGLHIRGLHIYGSTTSIPSCGILMGPRNTDTCGNNKFDNVKTTGYFSKAAAVNIGSETTQHIFSYFINENTDSAAYAYIADGVNRFGLTSDYAPIRVADDAVSFTNNRFIGCRFQKSSNGGSFWGEACAGFQWDADCYFLCFGSGANVTLRQSGAYRCSNLRLNGLFESTNGDGVNYALLVVQTNGEFTTLPNCEFNFSTPHAEVATIRAAQLDGTTDLTTGVLRFDACTIRQYSNQSSGSIPMWEGDRMYFSGEIFCDTPGVLNMGRTGRVSRHHSHAGRRQHDLAAVRDIDGHRVRTHQRHQDFGASELCQRCRSGDGLRRGRRALPQRLGRSNPGFVMQLVPVPLDYVEKTAHHWQHHLAGISQGTGFPPEEHMAEILRGEVIPLTAWDGTRTVALAGARIEVDGNGNKVCHIVWCTGKEPGLWFDLVDSIEAWARDHMGCVAMKGDGPPGLVKTDEGEGLRREPYSIGAVTC